MNANRAPGLRAVVLSVALALVLLAPGTVLAEVGVAKEPGAADPLVVYTLDGSTEDPTPINPVWQKLGPVKETQFALNPEGEMNGDGTPSLIANATASLVVAAWSRNSTTGFDIVVSRFVSGAWTTPQVVAGLSANELDPQLVLDPNGTVHMFYWVDGLTPEVFHTMAPPDLSSWSTPEPVSQLGQSACHPAGAFFDGVLRVAYEVHEFGNGNTPKQVVLARFESGGFTPEVVAMTNNLGNVRPQVHSHGGHLWVDWVDTETSEGSGEIAWTRMIVQGQWDATDYEPYADHDDREYRTRGTVRLLAIE